MEDPHRKEEVSALTPQSLEILTTQLQNQTIFFHLIKPYCRNARQGRKKTNDLTLLAYCIKMQTFFCKDTNLSNTFWPNYEKRKVWYFEPCSVTQSTAQGFPSGVICELKKPDCIAV